MVARLVRDQKVVGSSPVTSTTEIRKGFYTFPFFVYAILSVRGTER